MAGYMSDDSDSDDEMLMNVALLRTRRPKNIRPRIEHFIIWNDEEFFIRFRLKKATVLFLLEQIEDELETWTDRSMSPMNQLLMTLRFYALGTMLLAVGDFSGVHKSTASVVIKRVSLAIARLVPRFVCMPQTAQEVQEIYHGFYEKNRFPRVLGGNNGEVFCNRKGWFSFNVQTICDHRMRIMDIVGRWPGSAHDQNIFNNSGIRARLERGEFGEGLILGDSGYTLQPYLITPIRNAQREAQQLFNESQIRTRTTVERQYGIWKRRFPVLSLGIRLSLETTQDVIAACAVVHNIAPLDPQLPELDIAGDQIPQLQVHGNENAAVQRALVEYFQQLA